jgi:hypothetical protein
MNKGRRHDPAAGVGRAAGRCWLQAAPGLSSFAGSRLT